MRRLVIAFLFTCLLASPLCGQDRTRFPLLENGKALERIAHRDVSLPAWARMLAGSMPRTTVEMLKLDYVHRAKNPLDAVLRGKIRWAAADAIGCEYSKKVAAADLVRAGLKDADLKGFLAKGESSSADESVAISLARKLTTAGHSVTDAEMADAMKRFGPKAMVAIVHTLAHANFQDRIFLALGVKLGPAGPQPPIDLSTQPGRSRIKSPKRRPWESVQAANKDKAQRQPGWRERSFAELKKSLQSQQGRKSRIALPDPKEGSKKDRRAGQSPVVWNKVGMIYQPELTQAWFRCMGTFYREAQLDRVFSNSMFWVVTRSNECFY